MLLDDEQIRQAMKMIMDCYPNAGPSLQAQSHFQYLIAVMLSAQTTDKSVNRVTPQLFAAFPDAQTLAQATVEQVEALIKSLGLYHTKAKHLILCAQQLVQNFDGQVPTSQEKLITLSGVGTKTANVVLSDCFGIPAFAVDTHVSKIAKRLHFVEAEAGVQVVEKRVTEALASKDWIKAHHALIDFGREFNFHNEKAIEQLPIVQQCDQWVAAN
ncbi:endonuclease III [Bombilactobacillus folatiphilus]|uniref:Endonuclease III n=1 Tax=Bombilactobacillus folatiphilus TaxID=2923362 RepID=A0ABY4P7F2_9LACO|nr:endonuclease III [Bombilactobacillus folatiphilus]UQS81481.1 endonuclease III [Bombilactobacillus folatiphilus]